MKFPIGIQTFEKIIEGGYVYVDKTELIHNLVTSGNYYFLSRPRRFGKSLLTTTLESYFLGKKELFKGLALEKLEQDWIKYPVFHIDFSAADYTKPDTIKNRMNVLLSLWENQYGKEDSEITIGDRIFGVVSRAAKQTEKKVVILIDEYDKPLTDTIGMPEIQDSNRALLQEIYGIMKRADRYIQFAFLTGVTRYGKLGIFSAANNPNDISTSKKYASICGITEKELHTYFDSEIKEFAAEEKITVDGMYSILKNRYDGYHFCEKTEDIYNPFSLLNAIDAKQIKNFWFATGTPTYLARILKQKSYDLTKFNKEIVSTAEGMASFGNGEDNIVAALYQSGYITIKDYEDEMYKLGFPNDEVADGFVRYLAVEFTGKDVNDWDTDIYNLKKMILRDEVDSMMSQMQLITSQIPFESNEDRLIEANFRNIIYLMIRATGHKVTVEHPVLGGRIDIFFETDKCIYIIECKRNGSAKEAIDQIEEKKYHEKISTSAKQIVKIGANFSTDKRNLTDWIIE